MSSLFSWARCWSTGRECKTMDYWHFSHVWCAISHQKGCATLICMCFLSLIQSDNMVAHTNSSIWLNYVSILNHLDYCCIIRYLFINSSVNYNYTRPYSLITDPTLTPLQQYLSPTLCRTKWCSADLHTTCYDNIVHMNNQCPFCTDDNDIDSERTELYHYLDMRRTKHNNVRCKHRLLYSEYLPPNYYLKFFLSNVHVGMWFACKSFA